MSYPRAIRRVLGDTQPHNHKNGAEHCLVCQQHDMEAHRKAREGRRTTECPKCQEIMAAIDASAKPVLSDDKIEMAQEVTDRILGER